MILKAILGFILCLTSFYSFAEYRVYQYLIRNTVKVEDSPSSRLITSSLDPISYQAYSGGSNLVKVDLLRTWICPGYTGDRQEYCKSPYEKFLEE